MLHVKAIATNTTPPVNALGESLLTPPLSFLGGQFLVIPGDSNNTVPSRTQPL
ncbi:unnamed protein product, partial [marine sediment metagenome]